MRQTGLGIGRGVREPATVDACVLAAWLLSGGVYRDEYLSGDPNRKWLIEAAKVDSSAFRNQLADVDDRDAVLKQLRRVDHLSARRAYRSVQARNRWRSSVRETIARSETTRRALSGEILAGSYLSDDG